MKKIRVLILPSDQFGVGHYRSIWVGQALEKYYGNEFSVDIRLQVPVTENDLGKFDIVHFHRRINIPEETQSWINRFKESGAVVISDIDDYWLPFIGHPARELVISKKIHLDIINCQRSADWVTTTTEIYRKKLLEFNKNVFVIPNAVDVNSPQWSSETIKSDKIRIAWIGGSSHERDLKRIDGTFNKLYNDPEVSDKIQIVMCGYDTRGTVTEINPVTKEERSRPIKPEESIWNKFENIFNDHGHANKDQYVRRNTLPITKYGIHYDYCDICLAPLDQHTFNECKSELKIIETGMKKKALIASNLYIYKELLTNGENALLIDPKNDHSDWYKCIKKLVLDDELRNKLSNNLHDFVYPKYTLEGVTKLRSDFYRMVLKK